MFGGLSSGYRLFELDVFVPPRLDQDNIIPRVEVEGFLSPQPEKGQVHAVKAVAAPLASQLTHNNRL